MAELGSKHLPLRPYTVHEEGGIWVLYLGQVGGIPLPKGDPVIQEKRLIDLLEQELQILKASVEKYGPQLRSYSGTPSSGHAFNNSHTWTLPEEFGGDTIQFYVHSHQVEGAFERPRNQREVPVEQW